MSRFMLFLMITFPVIVILGGCGPKAHSNKSTRNDLTQIPVSAELDSALVAARLRLEIPDPDIPSIRDMVQYEDLRTRLKNPVTRQQAGEELYTLWHGDPKNFLWIELAKNNNYLLDRGDELAEMCARPDLSDTTTAVGAYLAGRLRYKNTDRGQMFHRAEQLIAELDPLSQVWLNAWLASADHGRGETAIAIRRLLRWLPDARSAGGAGLELILWRQIAGLLTSIDRLDDAMHAVTMATTLADHHGDSYRVLEIQIRAASIMEARQEYSGALSLLQDCAGEAETHSYNWLQQDSLGKAAEICSELGDYPRALEFDRRNLTLALTMGDPLNIPITLGSIAHDYRMLGQLDSCLVNLTRAQKYVDAYGDPRYQAKMVASLAEYHCLAGNYDQADSLLNKAEHLDTSAGTRSHEARLLLDLLPQAVEMGRTDLAYRWLARLGQLKTAMHKTGFDQNLNADYEFASTHLFAQQGEFGLAAEALQRAKVAVDAHGGEGQQLQYYYAAGELARMREDPRTAYQFFAKCQELAQTAGNTNLIADCRIRQGMALLQDGHFRAARELFLPVDGDTTFGQRFRNRLVSLLFRGLTYTADQNSSKALSLFNSALELCTPYSPQDLVARLKVEKARAMMTLGDMIPARKILLEVVSASPRPTGAPALVPELDLLNANYLRDAVELLIRLEIQQSGTESSSGASTLKIAETCLGPRGSGSTPETKYPSLVYLVGREQSFAWAIGGEDVTVVTLPGRQALQNLLAPVLADLSNPNRVPDSDALGKLSAVILTAAANIWHPGETLVIYPDGPLQKTPWYALPLPLSFGENNKVLVLDYGPIVEGSDRQPTQSPSNAVAPKHLSLLAVGCNTTSTGSVNTQALPALRHAEQEAFMVTQLWPSGMATLLTGDNAGWNQLTNTELSDAGVIHIASHAFIHRGLPHRSTLRLAGPEGAEPVTLSQIAALELNSELVFLSCCNAAYRASPRSSGVSDFADAFLTAGAQTVLASTQWIDDEAAAFLAESFYRNWLAGKTKAQALRASLQEMREARADWKHPAYWAFYRLIGVPD